MKLKRKSIRRVIAAIPEIYSLSSNDYSKFVTHKDPAIVMRDNWRNLGNRLNVAIKKVGHEATKKQEKQHEITEG